MLDRVGELLARCGSDATVLPPTELYNEGWMLRLVLDWFDQHRGLSHELGFHSGSKWYSEALLAPAFLPENRGDARAESFTHADGIVGHFAIRPGERAEAEVLPDAQQLKVIEAKLGSALSSGVKNAPDYDQAARNVACMANMLAKQRVSPTSLNELAFYVVAPQAQIEAGVFGDLVGKASVHRKVAARVQQYGGSRDRWFREAFEPFLDRLDLGLLSWESILSGIAAQESANALLDFYGLCLRFNSQRPARAV